MRKKSILLGMIVVAVLSFNGCGNYKNDKTTEVVTEASLTEDAITTEGLTEATSSSWRRSK